MLNKELKILKSDVVQNRIKEIKKKLGFIGEISRIENYAIYEELLKDGYPIQKYIEYLKESDKRLDELCIKSKNKDELINNLKKEGYLILR